MKLNLTIRFDNPLSLALESVTPAEVRAITAK